MDMIEESKALQAKIEARIAELDAERAQLTAALGRVAPNPPRRRGSGVSAALREALAKGPITLREARVVAGTTASVASAYLTSMVKRGEVTCVLVPNPVRVGTGARRFVNLYQAAA